MQESYTQIIGIDMAEIRCPYHHASWRCRTQHILNCLRGRLLTRMQAKKFSSYVCVCPGRPSVTSREMLDAAPDLAAWLQGKPSSLPEEVRRSLELYLTAAEELKPAELGLGLVHLVSVIRRAVEGKLEEENSAPSQIKPQYKEDTWMLSLPSRYIGLLVGRGGQHIQTLCREHKAGIYFGKKQSLCHRNTHRLQHYQATHRDSVQVTVVTMENELVNIEAIKSTLETRAEELKVKRKSHEEAVEKYRQRRYRRYLHAVHDPWETHKYWSSQRLKGSSYGPLLPSQAAPKDKAPSKEPGTQCDIRGPLSQLSHCILSQHH
ncbi:hypothetical protein GBAR_LOCUS28893 [Geodia barretti]|uniref:K Homology domain-containing protein n=1 Tax=Geodia barretti TaxID=519541 RepID=A0AA35TS01_GEOBA|nr:hypothetical protein GBAR_LOCUS28893 [Geodia barretti]